MRWLYANPGYKLFARVIAALLWGVSHSSSQVERGFDVPLVITSMPEELVVTDQSTAEVNVRVTGTRAALRNLSPADLEFAVDASGAKPGVLEVSLDMSMVEVPRGVDIVSRSPSRLEVTFAKRASKVVKVREDVSGEPAEGFRIGAVKLEPERVRISGAEAEVHRLSEVLTETVDITGAEADVVREVRVALRGRNVWLDDATPLTLTVEVEALEPPEEEADAEEETTG